MNRGLAALVAVVAVLVSAPAAALAIEPGDSAELRNAVSLDGIREHEQKLQQIANAHQGNRAAATVGYDQSVAYVQHRLQQAGYDVRLDPFDFPDWEENSPPELEQLTPTATTYTPGTEQDSDSDTVDFITFQFSGAGNVSAAVIPTNDVNIPPAPDSEGTSGCESTDFPAQTDGAISLVQRGTCPFVQKLDNAAAAGAVGVILFNEGQPGRTAPLFTGASPYYPIPAVFSSFAVGEDLYEAFEAGDAPTARIAVDAETIARTQYNVIADSPWGNPDSAVVVGGHLDSVPDGPGINDNGSGTSAILETAEQMAALKQRADAGVADARGALEAARAKLDQAERRLADAERRLTDAERRLTNAERKVSKRKDKVQKAKRKLRKADGKKERKRAKRKLRKAKRKLTDARADRDAARADRDAARTDRDQARDARDAARAEVDAAQAALDAAAKQFDPKQSVRFAFWGAEEAGLIGSTQYVDALTEAERAQILLNLNFDMLGSPNFARFVYDGNTDQTPPPEGGAPPGSGQIERTFLDYFASQGLPTAPTAFDGRSDYGPFIAEGIPAGGLFSGAEGIKTEEEVGLFGGVAGEQYDPCYHEACDTFDSVFGAGPPDVPGLGGNGAVSLDQMSDAVAHATLNYVVEPNPLASADAVTANARSSARADQYPLDFRGSELAAR